MISSFHHIMKTTLLLLIIGSVLSASPAMAMETAMGRREIVGEERALEQSLLHQNEPGPLNENPPTPTTPTQDVNSPAASGLRGNTAAEGVTPGEGATAEVPAVISQPSETPGVPLSEVAHLIPPPEEELTRQEVEDAMHDIFTSFHDGRASTAGNAAGIGRSDATGISARGASRRSL